MAVSRFDGALGRPRPGPAFAIAPIDNLSLSLGLILIGGERQTFAQPEIVEKQSAYKNAGNIPGPCA